MTTRRFDLAQLEPWIEVRFDRSAGPGGQNVNKVSTRATLMFNFRACKLLSDAEAVRVAQRCATRLTRDGRLRVVSQRARTQAANRALAGARLIELLAEALHVPKKRKPTRPTAISQRRRVATKRRHGELKQARQSRWSSDD